MPRCDRGHQGQPAAASAWFHPPRWREGEGLDVGLLSVTFHVSGSYNLPGSSVLCYSTRGLDIWGFWEGFLMRRDSGLLPGSEIRWGSGFGVVSANLDSGLTFPMSILLASSFVLSHICAGHLLERHQCQGPTLGVLNVTFLSRLLPVFRLVRPPC